MIHLGDCLEKLRELPDESVEAVITDPPYCSGGFNEAQKQLAKGQGLRTETIDEIGWFFSDNMSTGGITWLMRHVGLELFRVMKPSASLLMFTDWRMLINLAPVIESCGFQYRALIVWDKGSPGLGNGFRPQHELIILFVKGSAQFFDNSTGNVLRSQRMSPQKRIHQTEKPTDLLAKLLKVTTKEGDTVLDPFFGSGSLGEACLKMNRKFIGIEKSKFYVQEATRRIEGVKANIDTSLFSYSDCR